ncbi:MAG: carboxylesterase/lipase family protein, partial [Asticcacaulis sp.]
MNRRETLIALTAAATMTPVASRAALPAVMTTNGPVTGTIRGGVTRFLGLRYGSDTGRARFRPPVRPAPWTEPIEAATYGRSAPQSGSPDAYGQGEDCLFLNVWTPDASPRRKRPVMVYIHGGAYNAGSGSDPLYDGTNLCLRGDVVVVTLNHRLNVFGYLYLARIEHLVHGQPGPLRYSGNAGQMDLHLALEWVRDNISAFGGDPGCVMVFGQSGGGAKIATMMATPAAEGLFHRAATMSGQQVTASGPGNATARATAFLATLGVKPDSDGLEKVQTLPVEALIDALKTTDPVIGSGGVYMGPVVDQTVLFRHPFYPDAAPQGVGIPMMIGNTHDETRAFLGGDATNFTLTWEQLPEKLAPNMRVDIQPEAVIAEYRRLYPRYSPSEVFFAATTAGRSWRGAVIEAE